MGYPACLEPFPPEIAESLLEMALGRIGIARDRLDELTDGEKARLDADLWRLITAADVSDRPCGE